MPDVRMPNGTIIRNVPEGTTKEELLAKLEASGRDVSGFQPTPQQPPQERTAIDEAGRVLGRTGRIAIEGVGDAVFGLNDIVNMAVNGALQALGVDYRQPIGTDLPERAADALGLAKPETAGERVADEAGKFVAGAAVPVGAAQRVAGPVAKTLAQQPGIQAASAAGAGAAGQVAEEAGAGPVGQTAATIAGSLAPGAAGAGRALVRGGNAQRMRQNIDTFERAGTDPTLAQATQSRSAQTAENLLDKVPGSSGVIAQRVEQTSDELAATLTARADEIAAGSSATRAGNQAQRGISGPGGFAERFRDRAAQLYDRVDEAMSDGVNLRLKMPQTNAYLKQFSNLEQEAPEIFNSLSSNTLKSLREAMDGQQLSYGAAKELRTLVGERLGNLTLTDDLSKGQLKKLYGALSDDITSSLNDEAQRASRRADAFYRAGIGRLEELERVINKNGGGEAVFNAIFRNTKDGATTLRTVWKSLEGPQRRELVSAYVRRMGRATPGQQDASGEAFSIQTFLTNWNRLSPEARGTLFSSFGKEFQRDMDALADVAGNIREGSKAFRNPSGTGQVVVASGLGAGGGAAAFTGNVDAALYILGSVGAANVSAKLMTSPRFVRWLAQSSKAPEGIGAAQINALSQIASRDGDREMALFAATLEQQQENPDQN